MTVDLLDIQMILDYNFDLLKGVNYIAKSVNNYSCREYYGTTVERENCTLQTSYYGKWGHKRSAHRQFNSVRKRKIFFYFG